MKVHVIGFEGGTEPASLVSWGGAALKIGDELVNPGSDTRLPWDKSEIEALVADGALTKLPKKVSIPEKHANSHLIVLQISRAPQFAKALHLDKGRLGDVVKDRKTETERFLIFDSERAFEQCARQLCTQILSVIVYDEPKKAEREKLLDAALVLNSRDPFVNALNVWFSPRPEAMKELVTSHLRPHDLKRFESALDLLALVKPHDSADRKAEYILKYEKGMVPKSGGLDIDAASALLTAMRSVDTDIRKLIKSEFPFLTEPPPMHVQELKAASAEFHFSAIGDVLGDRLARLIELRYLERALEGEEDALSTEPKVRSALMKISSPDDETELRHKPVGETKIRDLASLEPFEGEIQVSDPFAVLGYQSGLVREGERVEVTYFPGRRLTVPGSDNGDGELPVGLDFLQTSRDFLFTPMIYTFRRHEDERGRARFYLQKVSPLARAKGTITALPSAIVPGAFIYRLMLPVSLSNGTVSVGKLAKIDVEQTSAGTAHTWMQQFEAVCLEYELEPAKPIYRIKPSRPVSTALGRLLTALDSLGGEASVSKVVTEINARFGTNVRVNNTRREVLRHSDLLTFTGERQRDIALTDRGRNYFRAYVGAGGMTSRQDAGDENDSAPTAAR